MKARSIIKLVILNVFFWLCFSTLNAQYIYVIDGNGKNLTNGQILKGDPITVHVDIIGNQIIIDNHNCVEIPMGDPTVRCIQDIDASRITGRKTLYYYSSNGEMKRAVLFGDVPVINEMHLCNNSSTYSNSNGSIGNNRQQPEYNTTNSQSRKKCLYTGAGDKLHCGGDGKCSRCGGDGLMDGFGINNVKCTQCNGSGKCISCHGTGFIDK